MSQGRTAQPSRLAASATVHRTVESKGPTAMDMFLEWENPVFQLSGTEIAFSYRLQEKHDRGLADLAPLTLSLIHI